MCLARPLVHGLRQREENSELGRTKSFNKKQSS